MDWKPLYEVPHGYEVQIAGRSGWAIGRFVSRPGAQAWRIENVSGPHAIAVFPSLAVEIAQSGRRKVVANANCATFYNAGTPYRRALIDPRGDNCVYLVLPDAVWRDVVAHYDPAHRDGDEARGPFRFASGPVPAALRLRYHRLMQVLDATRGAASADPLYVEEQVVALGAGLVAHAASHLGGRNAGRTGGPTADRHDEAVRALEAAVCRRYRTHASLAELAADAGLSAFHAARLFRRHTGLTIHQYRDQLRLRAALPRLGEGGRIDEIALDLGYANHSHFTDRFRQTFGVPPSAVR